MKDVRTRLLPCGLFALSDRRELGIDGSFGERSQFVGGHARVELELVAREDQAQVGVQVDATRLRAAKSARKKLFGGSNINDF